MFLVDGLNYKFKKIDASLLNIFDDSMSDIYFWNTVKGRLPHLSYILRNTESPGTEFNDIACSVTGGMISLYI